ncbi:hypothetical protein H0H93_012009, partial [Arthromyces matolae]
MSSDPTPPPPGDNSLSSWQKYDAKATERDKEADREVIDKMLEIQKQFVSPSKAPTPPPIAGPTPPVGPPSTALAFVGLPTVLSDPLAVDVVESVPPPGDSSVVVPSNNTVLPSPVVPPPLPIAKKSSVVRKMSSKPEISAEDRKRISAEMQKVGPSRAQLLAAAEGVGNPSEEWWKEQPPCLKCGRNGDCIPHWSKNSKRSTLTSCKLCHIKRVPCSLKIDWQISELVRLHPEWPGWWIVEKEREGWLKKTRGAKVEPGAGSSSKVPSKGKGKRKVQSEEEEEEESNWESSSPDADGDSDPEAVVEL